MQIFIDSADPNEVRQAYAGGLLSGVTTNPSLAGKSGKPYAETVTEILNIIGPEESLSLETIATETDGMVSEGQRLSQLDHRIAVKVPATPAGIQATKILSSQGIKVNVTLVFTANQALAAALAGAHFVSLFVGRLEDKRQGTGIELVKEVRQIFNNYMLASRILFASVRKVQMIAEAAKLGVDVITVPKEILDQMLDHPLTTSGLNKFLQDWEKSKLQLPG